MRTGEQLIIDVCGMQVRTTWKRVKNINLRIGSDGTPCMSVPLNIRRDEAIRLAKEHASWFEQALARTKARSALVPQKWQTGEKLNVWGTATSLRLVPHENSEHPCELANDELLVWDYPTPAQRAHTVENWLTEQLASQVRTILPNCESATGLHASHITIRRMKTRWGSCTTSTARIRLNTALAECPPACTQMVLVHELCHLKVRNHGPRFQALMDLHCPDWRATQRWLDEHPPSTRTFL